MEGSSRLRQWLNQLFEKISEHAWFRQLKAKWDELDPQSRTYLRFAAGGACTLLVLLVVFNAIWNVRSLRNELAEKADILNQIQTANEEMRRLKDAVPRAAVGGRPGEQDSLPWNTYLESTAATSGIDKSNLTISDNKPGTPSEQAKETLIDISLKKVSIRQVTRYAYQLENGPRPVKLRNLLIDTNEDPEGYMDATLSVSAFTLKQ